MDRTKFEDTQQKLSFLSWSDDAELIAFKEQP